MRAMGGRHKGEQIGI